MAAKVQKYEKISFLGEGQVKNINILSIPNQDA